MRNNFPNFGERMLSSQLCLSNIGNRLYVFLKKRQPTLSYTSVEQSSRHMTGADPGIFLAGSAPLRNGVTDWLPDETIYFCGEYQLH